MTPVWVPLVAAALALVGILWTQRAADQRADKERVHAERRAEFEAEQTALAWARNQRRDAHASFLAEQWRAMHMMTMYNQLGAGQPAEDWTEPMAREAGLVRIFASPAAAEAAEALLKVTTEMGSSTWGVGRTSSWTLPRIST